MHTPANHDHVPGLRTVDVADLSRSLGFAEAPGTWLARPRPDWTMESDDFVLRYIFRNFRPARHLEFGTWEGDGVIRCLEECEATIWTINVLEGETKSDGQWAYASSDPSLSLATGAEQLVTSRATWVRTDAYGMIGRKYLARGFGPHVCQIYADSRQWDTSRYPDGFFDSAFVDGGHAEDVVRADTRNALRLVRRGGLVIWHDFCLDRAVRETSPVAHHVMAAIAGEAEVLRRHFDPLIWVNPSWLLIGVRH